jgi:hypothetical protein
MNTRLIFILSLFFIFPSTVRAYETDQFSNRQQPIQDSTSILNRHVTLTIARTITNMHGPRDEMKVVNGINSKIGGFFWVDKLERYAMTSDDIDRLETPRYRSIYRGVPVYATRFTALSGVGPTLKINNVLIGTDKLGHFTSQGLKFYRRMLKMKNESRAAERSAHTEKIWFGKMLTGTYSNADLVANYEGYLFYRSLFEDNVIKGKPAILAWKKDHWIIQRPFDWADHVNEYWDEALNINEFDITLNSHMKTRFLQFCTDYHSAPHLYAIKDEEALIVRYGHLQLRDTSEMRLDALCQQERNSVVVTTNSTPINLADPSPNR